LPEDQLKASNPLASARAASILDGDLRARIADFLVDYAHVIDDDRLEEWSSFFTDDAKYHITTRESDAAGLPIGIMHCRGRGMLEDRILALRTANVFEPHTYCHLLGATRLVDQGNGIIAARTNFTVTRTMQDGGGEAFAIGKYIDEIVVDGERLAIRSRRVVLESRRVDVLLVIPL
jgi:anthranilate 1,2-dioxygenase small subunit